MNDSGVSGEKAGKDIALEHDQGKDHAAKSKAYADPGKHRLLGSLWVACSNILRDKGGHGLHQGTGHQHGKVDDLAGHTVPGGSLQPQAVDKGAQSQEGELGQKFLESQGQTDGKKFAALWVKTEVGAF